MFFRYLISLFFFLACSWSCWSQNSDNKVLIDSLKNLIITNPLEDTNKVIRLSTLARLNRQSNPQATLEYGGEMLRISRKLNFFFGVGWAYGELFYGNMFLGSNADSLLKYASLDKEHLDVHSKAADSLRVLWNFGIYYGNVGKQSLELDSWLKALELARRNKKLNKREGPLLNNIAAVFFEKGDTLEALTYYKYALSIAKKQGEPFDKDALGNMNLNIGSIYVDLKDSAEYAIPYLERAMEYYKASEDYGGIGIILMARARLESRKGNYKIAEKLYFEALDLAQERDLGYFLPGLQTGLTMHYFNRKDYKLTVKYGEMAYDEVRKQNNYYSVGEFLSALHQSHAKLGDFQRAYEIKGELDVLRDSLSNDKLRAKTEELQTKFQLEQKERENQFIKAKQKEEQRIWGLISIALLLGLLLVSSWGVVIYRSNRQKLKYNKQLEQTVRSRTSELVVANKDLEQANYELRTFNFIASHDIKEPIRNIGTFVGLIQSKLPGEQKANLSDFFEIIHGSITQLYNLIEDFARYTAMSRDEKIELGKVNLEGLVQNIENGLRTTLEASNGRVVYENLPKICSSESLLYSILKNLIENGLKFNESAEPTVKVSFEAKEGQHRITVSDNGIGIDSKYQEQVFSMFKRLHSRGEYQGTGMGLAIVKLMTEKLNGSIQLESKEGEGSTFILVFPEMKPKHI